MWNLAEAERRKREEAERKAKLDEIAEKQRQRELELEEKERKRREEVLGKPKVVPAGPLTVSAEADGAAAPAAPAAAAAAAAAAPAASSNKYVPKFKRTAMDGAGQVAPPESERRGVNTGRSDDRAPERWGGSRPDERAPDRWRDDRDRRPAFGGSRPGTWSSSRSRGER